MVMMSELIIVEDHARERGRPKLTWGEVVMKATLVIWDKDLVVFVFV